MRCMQRRKAPILDAIKAYDAFAPYYQAYSETKHPYLRSIERIVALHAKGARSLLDAGSGDGVRAIRIAASVRTRELVLVEPSAAMRSRCDPGVEVLPCRISEIPLTPRRFDVITCLWNVLGHLHGTGERRASLERLKALLNPSGSIFLDVYHRYNAAAYGWPKTLLRMAGDFLFPSQAKGDAVVQWRVGDREIATLGHVFTGPELQRLFDATGLAIHRRWVIHHATGAERRHPVSGHLLFELRA